MDGLVASGVVVRFGGLVALDGVTVTAQPGRITGLIGPNGAGKTTIFNVICGFQVPNGGTVELDGASIAKESPARRARLGLGRTFQRMEAFGQLLVSLVAERGLGILMIEHDMSLVLNICDPIYVFDFGKPLMTGTPAEVRASELVRDAYLGKAAVA